MAQSPQLQERDAGIVQRGLWNIDQQAIGQSLSIAMQARMEGFAADADRWWDAAAMLAAQQPILDACDARVCDSIDRTVGALREVADTLVVIGTGGASLGAQSICAFAPPPARVLFLENCDAQSAHDILTHCNPSRTAWAIISKSGETVETLAASLALIARYEAAGVALAGRVVAITSHGPRPLRTLAEHEGWQLMDHPAQLGGRFSVFSCVGLLPAAFAGFDCNRLATAAREAWHDGLDQRDALLFSAANWFASSLGHKPLHVVMGYGDRLRPYTQWYKQLWAESLGKGGQGPTPITAVGAVDQHSQLQLYLDGARDKLFTLILPQGPGAQVPLASTDIAEIAYLSGHTMQDIMHASAEATCTTMRTNGLPIRVLKAGLGAEALCQLMARTMLETLLVAAMLGVDPYSQPAVEEGKQRTRRSLGMR